VPVSVWFLLCFFILHPFSALMLLIGQVQGPQASEISRFTTSQKLAR